MMLWYLTILVLASCEFVKAKVSGQTKKRSRLSLAYPNLNLIGHFSGLDSKPLSSLLEGAGA